MLAGIGLFIFASLIYLVVPPQFLILVRFLQGLGAAALSAVSIALVGVYFETDRGRAYGVYNAIKGAGYVVSPIVGGYIRVQTNFAMIFIATALIGVVALGVALVLPRPPAEPKTAFDEDDDWSWSSLTAVFREPVLRPWYLVTVINMFFVGILFGFLPVRVHELGVDALSSGVLLSVVAVSYLLVQPIAGALADRVVPERTIRVGLALAGGSIIAAPFVSGPALVLVSVLASVGVGTV